MNDAGVKLFPSQLPDSESASRPALSVVQSAGSMLARARQDNEWSIQHVADQLKLSPKQIIALEGDQFEALPKMVIVRGFVRTYAKLLRIDADPLVALLPKNIPDTQLQAALKPALSTPFLESRLSLMGRQDSNKKYLVGAVLFALFAAVFFIVQKTDLVDLARKYIGQNSEPTHEKTSLTSNVHSEISGVPASTGQEKDSFSIKSSASAPVLVQIDPQLDQKIQEQIQVVQNANVDLGTKNEFKTTPENSLVGNAPTASISILDKDVLKLKFRQDSWIQIKKENGAILTSHLAKAGTEESFSVKEVLQVRIGNAAGVDGVLRGSPLGIIAEKGSNVVNLSVK